MGVDGLKDLLVETVHLQQMAIARQYRLIWDSVAGPTNTDKASHNRQPDQSLCYSPVTLRLQVMQKVDLEHGDQQPRRAGTLLAGLGAVEPNQSAED